MKILSIRLKNLASLAGEHFIDFESEPLASSGLIAIVGKTGAGKSTILDAMCLALFNKIPRLKDSDGKLQDVDGTELLTNSPLTVLRRGTAHGFAELCFVAQDQKHYLARWEIKRSREKVDGKLQSVQRYLKCLTDGVVIADKAKAVDSSIFKITQLSFEQFTRAVLLAQSEVTAFLKARDSERGELLEYLTNSSIFAKIGQLAYERTKQITSQRKDLENVLGQIELLSDEDLTIYTAQFQQLNDELKQQDADKQLLLKHQQWFEQQQKYEQDIQLHQAHLTEQQQKSEQLNGQRSLLEQLEVFSSIRASVTQQLKSQNDLNQLQPKIADAQTQFETVQTNYQTAQQQFAQIDEQFKQQQNFEQQHQTSLEQVRHCIQEREFIGQQFVKAKQQAEQLQNALHPQLQEQQQLKQQIEHTQHQLKLKQEALTQHPQFQILDDGLATHIVQLQRFIQQYHNFEQQHGQVLTAKNQVLQHQQQLDASQQQFGSEAQIDVELTTLRSTQQQKAHQLHQLNLSQQQFQHVTQLLNKQQQQHTHCATLEPKLAHSQQLHDQQTVRYLEHKTARESIQRVLQQQRLLHTENIEQLRAQLIEGEACLVCGSTHHPYQQDQTALSNELFNLQQQQEQQALELEQNSLEALQQADRTHTQMTTEFKQVQDTQYHLNQELEQQKTALQTTLGEINLALDWQQDLSQIQQTFAHASERMTQEKSEVDRRIAQLDHELKSQRHVQQQIQHISQQLSILAQAEQTIQHIVQLLTPELQTDWQQHTLATAEQLVHQLQQRKSDLEQAEQLKQKFNELDQSQRHKAQAIEHLQQQIQLAEKDKAEYAQKGKDNTDTAIRLIAEMTQVTVDKPHEWLKQLDDRRQELQQQFNHVRDSFEQVRHNFGLQQRALDQLNMQKAQLEVQHHTCTLEIEQWLHLHPDFHHNMIDQLIQVSAEDIQRMRLSLQQADRELANAQSAYNTLDGQLKQHLTQQPELNFAQLQQRLQLLNTTIQQRQDERDGIKVKLELHQQNLDRQKQYAEQIHQIQTEEHRWGKISGLMGDSTGKKFRDYAQQYNLDILIEYANQQLSQLSQRYTLKRLENSLSLAIIDHDMDGEMRSVASLSGGESFLTALALSLAIANMASGSTKIESLFIDEGFGTLDASSLHMVMNALDQLQSQGRKVVLISHIQEMHERIPVQIQVKPLGAGASTIEVVS